MVLKRLTLPALALLSAACAGTEWHRPPYDLRFQREPEPQLHPKPSRSREANWVYTLEQTTTRPLGETLSITHWIDQATGGPPAHDVNALDEVIDSTWFVNRIGRTGMGLEAVVRGPNRDDGPAPGPLLVESGKLSGASPGLVVRDVEGVRFVVKFDPPAYPGLASNAELIATKILYAAGYNVPENHALSIPAKRLILAEGALGPGRHGEAVPLDPQRLKELLTLANPTSRGEVQALFSRIIEGVPVGPFAYEGRRADDPNDTIPHERRRSLRALRWFSAWINNTDTRASNTLDVFREVESGRGYLVHYLLDFGDALGSLGTKPKYRSDGYEPVFSWGVLAELFFSAGLRYRYWLPARRAPYRSVGMFEAEVFDPPRWSPHTPNPAFDACTPADTLWAAGIIARFTRPMVDAVVEAARYRRREATRYVADILWARRRKILDYAFAQLPPLFDPEIRNGVLHLTDLGVRERSHRAERVRYRWRFDGRPELPEGQAGATRTGAVRIPVPALDRLEVVLERRGAPGAGAVRVRIVRVGGRPHVVGLIR